MATPAIILVEGFTTAKLYKHWDGYPKSTLQWLEKFNREFTEKRGDDKSYKFAQLIRSSVFMQEEFGLDSSTETGWGVVGYDVDCGEEFVYILHTDGTVTYNDVDVEY